MNEVIEDWKRKKDWIVPEMRKSLEGKLKELELTFESYCQMMAVRFMQLLEKDPALWDFDLMEEYQ
tara:strand:- start:1649 stop:1846 length:198 start_codon:yes stop_codon:yes gene_type:complete